MSDFVNRSQHAVSRESLASGGRVFAETRWSQVALAGDPDAKGSRAALEKLCETYWRPIYAFLRRKGKPVHEAEDLTQEFFLRLLQGDSIAKADPDRGRFRSFLLGALNHFLVDVIRRASAQKRGGRKFLESADFREVEDSYLDAPDLGLTPDQVYDQQWAETLLQQALERLRTEFQEAGQHAKFEAFQPFLAEEAADGAYDVAAAQFGMSRGAVSKAVQRMRLRYQQLIRQEVAETVTRTDEAEAELNELFH